MAQVDQNGIVYDPKTEPLRQYTVQNRLVFGPYCTVLSGAELRTVLYPYRKRTVFDVSEKDVAMVF
jgi:hypothetical protein